jgi:hypothetical protein
MKSAYATIKGFEIMYALKKVRNASGNIGTGSWEKCA